MGIASGIFWIVFGLLYILYQAFKEHPSETISGVIVFFIIFGCIVGFTLTYRWLMDVNLVLGTVFVIGVIGFGCYKFAKFSHNETLKRQKIIAEYDAWMEEVRATMTEKDYEDYAREKGYLYNVSMNENSPLYWKKEPYYSKIKWGAENRRSGELAVERGRHRAQRNDDEL